jgi:hypothetical protein
VLRGIFVDLDNDLDVIMYVIGHKTVRMAEIFGPMFSEVRMSAPYEGFDFRIPGNSH